MKWFDWNARFIRRFAPRPVPMFFPSRATMRSPAWRPARSAGDPGTTWVTVTCSLGPYLAAQALRYGCEAVGK